MEPDESLDRTLADMEMLSAAYPDEIKEPEDFTSFPLKVSLVLSNTAHIELEYVKGYPVDSNVQIASYRSNTNEKVRMEATVAAVRTAANECLREGIEGGLACVAAALETWSDYGDAEEPDTPSTPTEVTPTRTKTFRWINGEPLLDRKSTFQAHACRVSTDADVREALSQLLDGNSKLQRATHNMVCAIDFLKRWKNRNAHSPLFSMLTDSTRVCPTPTQRF